jgi:hypothetical protein
VPDSYEPPATCPEETLPPWRALRR